mgnify:CR=1 FL=1
MSLLPHYALAIAATFLVNLPFGWWRAGLRKLSPAWFVAIHAPVPIVIGLRWALGLPFRWALLPTRWKIDPDFAPSCVVPSVTRSSACTA